jgi:hypothetical protein
MKEGDPKAPPEVKPQETEIKKPVQRYKMPDIDEIIDRRADDEMLGRGYNSWDDPEDLSTYFEPYQND